ncbi:NFACT family protein [Brevibacillus humidisoli]|uniref:Rqc2 family fibronectin-binding protein n=1 Tax=Brevibacillus humidisoli TaxID=2895522 RepID=UPI001E33B561|nr:NFACT RNA binding domain-containing protein [Brevibacillus humidisoli]UFJ43227.1 NFACT family protein [Brevibacillus humidisoli]
MAYDGMVTRAVAAELQQLVGGRISRIYQPHPHDIVLAIRAQGGNHKLLLSANPTYPRLHLTSEDFVNPTEPPMFCMLLRKHCEGGTIEAIRQVDTERIIHMDVKARNELGDMIVKRIIVEIMGRHSNVILTDPESNQILDSAQHVSHSISQYRQVLPGRHYVAPPDQGKSNPLQSTQDQFYRAINWNAGKLDRQIVDVYSGISPLLAKEVLHRAGVPTRENLWHAFNELMSRIKANQYEPTIVHSATKTVFSITTLNHLDGEQHRFESISACPQSYYQEKAMRDVVKQKVSDLIRIVTGEKNKNEKKIEKLEQTLSEAQDADRFRLHGELLAANLHLIQRGDRECTVTNWYDEDQPTITIPLDPLKTPSENMQSYYKRYNKAKNSVKVVNEQIAAAREEISYLEGILVQLEYASLREAEEIREELGEQGYVRNRSRQGTKRKKPDQLELTVYHSSDGIPILVGRNNKQNDYLTNKLAASSDTWLHTKDIPGSHVVVRSRSIPDQTLREAAVLAAYYSKARQGSQVPVDYTLVKHVKKPSGAKPGFCIYENQRTLYVTPDEALVRQLQKNKPAASSQANS